MSEAQRLYRKYIVEIIAFPELFPGQELYEVVDTTTKEKQGKFALRSDAESFAKKLNGRVG